MHRLQDAASELLKCHVLNGWGSLAVPTPVVSGSLTGPPWRSSPPLSCWTPNLQAVTWGLVCLDAQTPEARMPRPAVHRLVIPGLCGSVLCCGPRDTKWVGGMGEQPSNNRRVVSVSNQYVKPGTRSSPTKVVVGIDGCWSRSRRPRPARGSQDRQRRPTCALPWSRNNRCEMA
jgi:hypothetical protein